MAFWSTTLGKMLATFGMAMVPVIELRGSIPFGVSQGLPLWLAILLSIAGNIVPVPFIILFIRKIFAWMRKRLPRLNGLVTKMEQKADRHKEKVLKYEFWGLMVLVAIPIPGTGAWTGALVAAMLDMRLKKAFPSIALGVFGAAIIVSFLTYGVSIIL